MVSSGAAASMAILALGLGVWLINETPARFSPGDARGPAARAGWVLVVSAVVLLLLATPTSTTGSTPPSPSRPSHYTGNHRSPTTAPATVPAVPPATGG